LEESNRNSNGEEIRKKVEEEGARVYLATWLYEYLSKHSSSFRIYKR